MTTDTGTLRPRSTFSATPPSTPFTHEHDRASPAQAARPGFGVPPIAQQMRELVRPEIEVHGKALPLAAAALIGEEGTVVVVRMVHRQRGIDDREASPGHPV